MSATVERILYSDRTLLGYDQDGETVEGWAPIAYEAIRGMNHITSGYGRNPIPAPVAYRVLGNVAGMAHMLPQLFEQLAGGLTASLEAFDVYDTKQDAALSVQEAGEYLRDAVAHAQRLADALDRAQVAINSQGYNAPDDDDED